MDPEMQKMFEMVGQGLTQIVEGLGQAGAPPEVIEPFGAALEAYTAGYEALQGGGQKAQGAAPMEAGGAQVQPSGSQQMRG
jgi:hypothetical protein